MEIARTRQDDLATLVYWSDGAVLENPCLAFGGMPYITDLYPISKVLYEYGYDIVQPQYFGTFDSGGDFTPESAVRTVEIAIDQLQARHVRDHRGAREITWGTPKCAIAHSFGTNVLLQSLARGSVFQKVILFSPFLAFGAERERAGVAVHMAGHIDHMCAALPLTFRIRDREVWLQFFDHDDQWSSAEPFALQHRPTQVMLVVGDRDPSLRAALVESYARELGARLGVFDLVETLVVEGAGHDQAELLTVEAVRRIGTFLRDQ